MQTAQITNRHSSTSPINRTVVCSLIVLTAFGAIIADTLTKQRDASGEIVLELCKKGSNGQWVVIDRAKGAATFSASVLDVATGKEFKSNSSWEPRSEQGHQVSIKQSGPGKAIVDPATGEVTLVVTYDASVDGQTFSTSATLTNKSVSTPLGVLTGKKLEINGTTLSAGLSGIIEIKQRNVIDHLVKEPIAEAREQPSVAKEQKQNKGQAQQQSGSSTREPKNNPIAAKAPTESLVVVIRAKGSSATR